MIRRAASVLSIVLVLAGALAPAHTASANSPRPDLWIPNGQVKTSIVSGNTLYLGGFFTQVGPPTGSFVSVDETNGVRDTTWPRITGAISLMVPDGSGGLYLSGGFSTIAGVPRNGLAHLKADKSLDLAWNPNPAGGGVRTIVKNGSNVYVGGDFTSIGGQPRNRLAALDATTGAASAWNPNVQFFVPSASVRALAISGGIIYVGGLFDTIGGKPRNNIAAINLVSGLATNWDANANGAVFSLAVSGSMVFAGGSFTAIGGAPRHYLAALDATINTLNLIDYWNQLGAGSPVTTMQMSGTLLYVAGAFSTIGGVSRGHAAAMEAVTGSIQGWNPVANGNINALVVSGTSVYVGGDFTQVHGVTRNGAAKVPAIAGFADSWDPNVAGSVSAIVVGVNGVFLGGGFLSMNGVGRNALAAIDLTTGQPTAWNPNVHNFVKTMVLRGTTLYIGGSFDTIGGASRSSLGAVDTVTGLALPLAPFITNGQSTPQIEAITLSADGSTLYLGGVFDYVYSTQIGLFIDDLAAIDSSTGIPKSSWKPQPDRVVYTLAWGANNSVLYAGGAFTKIGLIGCSHAVGLDPVNANITSCDGFDNGAGYVNVITLSSNGQNLYLGGSFTSVRGVSRINIAAVSPTFSAVRNWNPGPNGQIHSIVENGGLVYIGGGYNSIGGYPRSGVASVYGPESFLAGGWATTWNPAASGEVDTMSFTGSTAYVGGTFQSIGPEPIGYEAGVALQPYATTNPASGISTSFATMNGLVTANGYGTSVSFEWGTAPGVYPTTTVAFPSSLTGSASSFVLATLINLTPGTTYYYRVKAVGFYGTVYGSERTFVTASNAPASLPPNAVTTDATLATGSSAYLNGVVNAGNAVTSVLFEYGTQSGVYSDSVALPDATGVADTIESAFVGNLSAGATYYFRLRASNAGGQSAGAELTFSTCADPCVALNGSMVVLLPVVQVS